MRILGDLSTFPRIGCLALDFRVRADVIVGWSEEDARQLLAWVLPRYGDQLDRVIIVLDGGRRYLDWTNPLAS
jgi:hypothetical protein